MKSEIRTTAPFIGSGESIRTIMLNVIVALIPALCWAVYVYGPRVLTLTAISVLACLLCELWFELITRRSVTISDLSAVVTGILIAFMLPVNVPLWLPAAAGAFAIVIIKQLFGGIGRNIFNPAVCGRIFASVICPAARLVPKAFTRWSAAAVSIDYSSIPEAFAADNVTSLSKGILPPESTLDLFLGKCSGNIGEISALMLLIGAVWLVYRRVITTELPGVFLITAALLTYIFPRHTITTSFMFAELFSGALFLGALFLACDSVTSPVTYRGKLLYGVGCGALSVGLRYYLGYDGVYIAILVMNLLTHFIDGLTLPVPFGALGQKNKQNK